MDDDQFVIQLSREEIESLIHNINQTSWCYFDLIKRLGKLIGKEST